MNNTVKLVIALAVGAALATAVNKLAEPEHEQCQAQKKPLYWWRLWTAITAVMNWGYQQWVWN